MPKRKPTPPPEPGEALYLEADRENDAGNYRRAFELFTQSMEEGCLYSINRIAIALEHGYGVRKNPKKAMLLFKKAAQKGDACAVANLGVCYRDRKNFTRARFWFLKALNEHKDGDCALDIAKLHLARSHNKRDIAQAKKYLRIALKSKWICEASLEEAAELMSKLKQARGL